MWNCTNFRHPTDEQLRLLDISSNKNLLSVLFETYHKGTPTADHDPEIYHLYTVLLFPLRRSNVALEKQFFLAFCMIHATTLISTGLFPSAGYKYKDDDVIMYVHGMNSLIPEIWCGCNFEYEAGHVGDSIR